MSDGTIHVQAGIGLDEHNRVVSALTADLQRRDDEVARLREELAAEEDWGNGWRNGYSAIEAQHEAAQAALRARVAQHVEAEARYEEAQREIERLKQKVASAETYGEKERGHFEHWFKRAEQAEAQVRVLREALERRISSCLCRTMRPDRGYQYGQCPTCVDDRKALATPPAPCPPHKPVLGGTCQCGLVKSG